MEERDCCDCPCRGIRGLLEHVGIDTRGKSISVAGKVVDPAPPEPCQAHAKQGG
jgi:hypothetical protein